MARTISDDELQLKRRARRRLIGAIVLVAAIVVVLPMALDSEPRPPGQAVAVQIPSPDSRVFAPQVVPPPAIPDSKAASTTAPVKPTAVSPAEKSEQIATAPVASALSVPATEKPKAVSRSVAKAEVKPAKPAARSDGKFVVQVIALADAGKAKQMQETIAAAGIKSYTEVVKTSKGDVTRVRAGPFASRGAAEKARDQLKALGMNGNITAR